MVWRERGGRLPTFQTATPEPAGSTLSRLVNQLTSAREIVGGDIERADWRDDYDRCLAPEPLDVVRQLPCDEE